jgi:nitroreductase
MTLTVHEVNDLKQAPAVEGVLPVFHKRWSARAFQQRSIREADLQKLFEAARWAPSAFNEQPWRFIVGAAGTETHRRIAAALAGFNQAWAPKAPVLILGVAKTTFSHNNAPNAYALYDLGAATASIVLQAAALGMTTHQMAGFDHEGAREAFGIPSDYAMGVVTALGYQGEVASLGEQRLIAQETSPRSRKPLGEIVFSAWNEPAALA